MGKTVNLYVCRGDRPPLERPFRWGDDDTLAESPSRIKQHLDWDLVLAVDHVKSALPLENKRDNETSILPQLLEDFQQLLLDALDLWRELDEANDRSDRSHWDLPSISPHWQNRGYRDWVCLIELLRDSWSEVFVKDKERARRIAQAWFSLPYPTFKRLAFFAASKDDCIPPQLWVEWLLADSTWWLWSIDTGREVYRLLVLQGSRLTGAAQERLESAILAGPPRNMYREDLEPTEWQDVVARSVWLHLSKLNSSGLVLGDTASDRLAELSDAHPNWQLDDNERDEFSHWMSGTGDPDFEDNLEVDIAPRKRHELVPWLRKPVPDKRRFYEDTWRDVCRTRFFHSLGALCDLGQEGIWPISRWREALQTWTEKDTVHRSWHYGAPLVQSMPDSVLKEIVHSVTWWIETVAKSIDRHEGILLDLCRRVLALPLDASVGISRNGEPLNDPVTEAINHPIGRTTLALINFWFKNSPNDKDLLPQDIETIFTELCDVRVQRYRHGRVILASRLIALFRVDRAWTEKYLLPLFDWDNSREAKSVWEGFLWSPRLYQPLLSVIKPYLLESANHYVDLGKHRQNFAAFLTYVALGPTEDYTVDEFRSAIAALPQEGLEDSAQALSQAVEGAADQREDYWKNRAQPFWQEIWPKSRDLATPRIAETLTRLAIAARGEFPTAFVAVRDWLQPIEHPDFVVHRLSESGLCKQFPLEGLQLLNAIIGDQPWVPLKLDQCLDDIKQASPQLAEDDRFLRLQVFSRRWGM